MDRVRHEDMSGSNCVTVLQSPHWYQNLPAPHQINQRSGLFWTWTDKLDMNKDMRLILVPLWLVWLYKKLMALRLVFLLVLTLWPSRWFILNLFCHHAVRPLHVPTCPTLPTPLTSSLLTEDEWRQTVLQINYSAGVRRRGEEGGRRGEFRDELEKNTREKESDGGGGILRYLARWLRARLCCWETKAQKKQGEST